MNTMLYSDTMRCGESLLFTCGENLISKHLKHKRAYQTTYIQTHKHTSWVTKLFFLQKRDASVLMTAKPATTFRIVRKYTLPKLSVPSLLVLKVEVLNYESGKSGQANPCRGKILKKIKKREKCESSEHTVSGTGSRRADIPSSVCPY